MGRLDLGGAGRENSQVPAWIREMLRTTRKTSAGLTQQHKASLKSGLPQQYSAQVA